MKLKVAFATSLALVLTLFSASTAHATLTPSPAAPEFSNDVVGFILKLKPGVNHIAPNGQPTGENYAGVGLENSRLIGGGYSAVTFEESLTPPEIEAALTKLKADPRVESVEPDHFIEASNYVARPIAPMILGVNEPVQLPIVIKTAIRLPTMSVAAATDAWSSGKTERVRISWSKPTGRYSGTIVGYRVQLYASGAWRTLRSQTYSSTRSHTTTSGYLKAGVSTPFRVAALIRSGGKTYVGYYKKVYATPTTEPQGYPQFSLQNGLSNVSANWNLLQSVTSRGGLPVEYAVNLTDQSGATVTCDGTAATQCVASNVVAGTRYTGNLLITNDRGTLSSPPVSITFSPAPAVSASNDPDFSKQWYLNSTETFSAKVSGAWAIESGLRSVIVAVLDTGYTDHPDIDSERILSGYDMISDASKSNDNSGRDSDAHDPGDYTADNPSTFANEAQNSSWHGTHVMGIIGASDNNLGVVGVAPNVSLLPIRVLGPEGGTVSDIVAGINWASGRAVAGVPNNTSRANVINMSIGGQSFGCDSATESALEYAKSRGITVVTAAGNDNGPATQSYPGNCYPTINIGSSGKAGKPAFYSNYSVMVRDNNNQLVPVGVDVSAPGGDYCQGGAAGQIYATLNNGNTNPRDSTYAYEIGTSMAAPVVSGIVALMYSAKLRQNPTQTFDSTFVESIWNALSTTATDFASQTPVGCTDSNPRNPVNGGSFGGYGAGIVNAAAAVDYIIR